MPDNSTDIQIKIQEGTVANMYSVELEDKTRFVSATYINVPLTTSALVDFTGAVRKEKPMERADVPLPDMSSLKLSGIGSAVSEPAKPSIGKQFSRAEDLTNTRLPVELEATELVDTLQLSDHQSLCLHALTDVDDHSAIRSFLVQYVEKAGSDVISNVLTRPTSRIR